MKISIRLLTFIAPSLEGFPLVVFLEHKGKQKKRRLGFSLEKHFLADEQIISFRHPDYDILMPIITELKVRARKIMLQKVEDIDQAITMLFNEDFANVKFLDFGRKLIDDMQTMAANLAKVKDIKSQNKLLGNAKVYENVLAQFGNFGTGVTLQNLDYDVLMRFRNYQLGIGNKKPTVHLYLRTLRAIYNKGVLTHRLSNNYPFKRVFDGLKTRSFDSRKKYIDRESLLVLERLELKTAKQKYLDLWLLQFYFGGCDLIDIYYLTKKQLRKGRIIFERTKVNGGNRIDLKVHPKAQRIIDKYANASDYLFEWGKERKTYTSFRRCVGKALVELQQENEIELLPDGGNLGIKVARHTFANIAKKLLIETDIIRELMGHERDEVDNYYKDKYPEIMRDMALFEIISSFECLK